MHAMYHTYLIRSDSIGIISFSYRRMFPGFSISISGLKPKSKYTMKLDIVLADTHRFKFLNARYATFRHFAAFDHIPPPHVQ